MMSRTFAECDARIVGRRDCEGHHLAQHRNALRGILREESFKSKSMYWSLYLLPSLGKIRPGRPMPAKRAPNKSILP